MKTEAVKTEAAKTEAAKTEATKTEATKTEATKTEAVETEAVKTINRPAGLAEFAAGARDTIPMMVGAAPFGVIFGTLCSAGPLSGWHTELMSLMVFAGSAQFIAAGQIAGHAGLAVIWGTALVVNLRHLLYSATLAPYVAHLPARWRFTLAAMLTDEVFAVSYAHYRKRAPGETGPSYFFGSGLSMYLNWQLWTIAGLLFGSAFPGLQSKGLDFAMVATFIAIVVPQLIAMRFVAAALTAGVLSFAWRESPYKLGLLAAVMAGVAVGMLLTSRAQRNGRVREECME